MKAFYKQTSDKVINDFSLQFSDDKFGGLLVANVEDIIVVPNTQAQSMSQSYAKKQYIAIFEITPGKTVWVALNATATVPGATGAIDVMMIRPGKCRAVFEGDELHIITGDAATFFSVEFYQIP